MAAEVIAIIGSVAGLTKTLIEISKVVRSFVGCARRHAVFILKSKLCQPSTSPYG
jgi:hypothetical protein